MKMSMTLTILLLMEILTVIYEMIALDMLLVVSITLLVVKILIEMEKILIEMETTVEMTLMVLTLEVEMMVAL